MSESIENDGNSGSKVTEAKEEVSTVMPVLPITGPATLRLCANLTVEPTDIFICSYPKSGTTWTQHIIITLVLLHRHLSKTDSTDDDVDVEELLNTEKHSALAYNHVSDYAPFYEIDPHWNTDEECLIEPIQKKHKDIERRMFNTHLAGQMLPTKSTLTMGSSNSLVKRNGKFIYLIRSPLDACVSFYHHLSNTAGEGNYPHSFDTFFQEWMDGSIPYGSWVDHVLSYVKYFAAPSNDDDDDKGNDNDESNDEMNDVMVIFYEDMVKDLSSTLIKLVKFLELDDLLTPSHTEQLLPLFTFSNMRTNLNKFQPISVEWKNNFNFLRKGIVGSSSKGDLMTAEQREVYLKRIVEGGYKEKLHDVLNVKNPEVLEKIMNLLE